MYEITYLNQLYFYYGNIKHRESHLDEEEPSECCRDGCQWIRVSLMIQPLHISSNKILLIINKRKLVPYRIGATPLWAPRWVRGRRDEYQ